MPLTPPSPEDAARFREELRAAGYTAAMVRELAGTIVPLPLANPHHAVVLRAAASGSAAHLLARLFFLGAPVDAGSARRGFSPALLDLCRSSGLVVPVGDELRPAALLTPCEGLWIAADLHQQKDSGERANHIQPVSLPALHLLNFMVRRPARAALDLCSGAGLHAMAAGAFAEEVVAADLNERAAGFGRFNAGLNGVANFSCVTGDLFEGLGGRRFDLIVSNPPFFLSPGVEFLYQDNPLDLDEFSRRLVRAAPDHLEEGGFCQVICEWVDAEGEPFDERLRGWFSGTGCDAWVLEGSLCLPESYCRGRVRENHPEGSPETERRVAEWTSHLTARGVRAVHGGLIALRKRQGANWVSLGKLPREMDGPCGDSVLDGFARRDFLEEHREPAKLLAAMPRVSPAALVEESSRFADGGWRPQKLRLKLTEGVPAVIGIDETVKQVLGRFDGHRTVAEVVVEMTGGDAAAMEQARPQILGLVRGMIETGVLLP